MRTVAALATVFLVGGVVGGIGVWELAPRPERIELVPAAVQSAIGTVQPVTADTGPKSKFVLPGKAGAILAAAITPDGKTLATGIESGRISLWDVEGQKLRFDLHPPGADPGITEEVKWRKPTNPTGVPVWEHNGIICTGEVYAKVVKFTFAHGASLPDPERLFNASLAGNARRAIDIREGETMDARAFKALVKAAIARNASTAKALLPKWLRLVFGLRPRPSMALTPATTQSIANTPLTAPFVP